MITSASILDYAQTQTWRAVPVSQVFNVGLLSNGIHGKFSDIDAGTGAGIGAEAGTGRRHGNNELGEESGVQSGSNDICHFEM